jgi:hypothetical protein
VALVAPADSELVRTGLQPPVVGLLEPYDIARRLDRRKRGESAFHGSGRRQRRIGGGLIGVCGTDQDDARR